MSDDVTINELQQLEQAVLSSSNQINSIRSKILEIDSALEDLTNSKKSYKIVGNIMISASNENIESDLKSEKEAAKARVLSLEKQEKRLRELFKERQELFLKNRTEIEKKNLDDNIKKHVK